MIYIVRHGETEWALNGRHTGKTDIPLTKNGERQAEWIGQRLNGIDFQMILSSPLQRALKTCEIAGFIKQARIDPDLVEWNYGECEGLTTKEIQKKEPHWNLFINGAPNGETVSDMGARANKVLSKIQPIHGNVLLFSHGHFLRALSARWLGLKVQEGRLFALDPGSLSILGLEHHGHVLTLWNEISRQC